MTLRLPGVLSVTTGIPEYLRNDEKDLAIEDEPECVASWTFGSIYDHR